MRPVAVLQRLRHCIERRRRPQGTLKTSPAGQIASGSSGEGANEVLLVDGETVARSGCAQEGTGLDLREFEPAIRGCSAAPSGRLREERVTSSVIAVVHAISGSHR